MMYIIDYTQIAEEHIIMHKKAGDKKLLKKLQQLLIELMEHPTTGTGHPKPLGSNRTGEWSRHIDKKHRLVYKILDEKVIVLVLSAYGHYDDK